MNHHDAYVASREALADLHDDGAFVALAEAADLTVECGAYCYGGSARLDVTETLAELAEQGWRLVRIESA